MSSSTLFYGLLFDFHYCTPRAFQMVAYFIFLQCSCWSKKFLFVLDVRNDAVQNWAKGMCKRCLILKKSKNYFQNIPAWTLEDFGIIFLS